MFLKRMPRLLQWILKVVLSFLIVMTIARFIFYFRYNPTGKAFSGSAFIMGLRFDLKFVCILGAAMLVLCIIPFFNPLKIRAAAKGWILLLALLFTLAVFFYIIDYYYFDYLQQRLNASILAYLKEASIAFSMVRETYPVFSLLAVILISGIGSTFYFNYLLAKYRRKQVLSKKRFISWYVVVFLLFAMGVFGKFGQFNLRWSDAFDLGDNFKANLALNPFQSFFSTFHYEDTRPDIKKVRENYALISGYMGVQNKDSAHLNYERTYPGGNTSTTPNIIVVICESFSMYKSSMSGNPLNTTPYFNELSKHGVFFNRCFTPSFPTARGVWATVTSLPDVFGDNNRSASRSPEVVNQQLIISDFKGYEKFYFLGGDPTWANIKGMLQNNIDSLHIYSQADFKASKLNVWGIDDKNLFLEANNILAQQAKPFFAIIQTADNHRPYTIPDEDLKVFKRVNYPEDTIHKYGFENIDQLNAFRYTDFCYQQFIEAAKKQKYFSNTIFVFVGDHGIRGNAAALYPRTWTEQGLSAMHTPLLFYAPALLEPKLVTSVCSQIDIMPSVAGLAKIPYRNNTMGRNLFDTTTGAEYAFIINHDTRDIGLVSNRFYFVKNVKTGKTGFFSMTDNDPVEINAGNDSIKNMMGRLTEAYYQTSRYLLFNNKRKR